MFQTGGILQKWYLTTAGIIDELKHETNAEIVPTDIFETVSNDWTGASFNTGQLNF